MARQNNKSVSIAIRPIALLSVVASVILLLGCEIRPVGEFPAPRGAPDTPVPKPEAIGVPISRYLAGAEGDFRIEALRGRPLLIALLGAGMRESPNLVQLLNRIHDEYQSAGLAVVGLLAAVSPEEDARATALGLEAVFPIAESTPRILASIGGARALPTVALIDSRGEVRKLLPGMIDPVELRAQLRDLLAEAR